MGFLDPRQLPIHALIPVLMHRGPERQRGENEAHLLAREVGNRLGIPTISKVPSRLNNTPHETKSPSAQETGPNVQRSFRYLHPFLVKRLDVVLVDDIRTTGTTLETCAPAL